MKQRTNTYRNLFSRSYENRSIHKDQGENCPLDKKIGVLLPPGGVPFHGLFRWVPPKRGTFFRLQVYERVGTSLVKVYERVGKSVISMCKKAQKG